MKTGYFGRMPYNTHLEFPGRQSFHLPLPEIKPPQIHTYSNPKRAFALIALPFIIIYWLCTRIKRCCRNCKNKTNDEISSSPNVV